MIAQSIEDLRRAARRRLPRLVYEFVDNGAEDGTTLRANRAAIEAVRFAPRTLVDVSARAQAAKLFGGAYASPFGIAPIGAAGICWREAEAALARAARAAGVPFTLSTHSFVPLERVAREAREPPWFQLYLPKDRGATATLLRRAEDAGCRVLMLTADVPVGGNREHDRRNGFGVPVRLSPRMMLDGLARPGWLANVYFPTLYRRSLPDWSLRRDRASWADLAWLREQWRGTLLVKGILAPEDALLAARHGADGVVVSNHGGRQLDGALATLEALPPVVAAAGDRLAVLVDGGFRRGADIVKALALGADFVLVGRAALYGVAAGGEPGALRALEILKGEIDRVLALLGVNSIAEVNEHYIVKPTPRSPAASRQAHAPLDRGAAKQTLR